MTIQLVFCLHYSTYCNDDRRDDSWGFLRNSVVWLFVVIFTGVRVPIVKGKKVALSATGVRPVVSVDTSGQWETDLLQRYIPV